MMSDIHECIAAFADGEPVDPDRLDRALADAEGRAYLIDLLVLRGLYRRRAALVTIPDASAAPARAKGLRGFAAAAALAAVSVLGGYVAGRQSQTQPSPERIVKAPASQPDAALGAPAPTRVIRLEPGVDWSERGGGD